MPKNIDPNLRKIGEYLKLGNKVIFKVPEYQRAYSWEISQCDKLWQNIEEQIEKNNDDRYFFGTVIISCTEDDTVYNLIDGQQRTTTFLLLLKALLMCINEAIGSTSGDDESLPLCNGLIQRRIKLISTLYKVEEDDVPQKPNRAIDEVFYQNATLIINSSINEQFKDDFQTIMTSIDYEDAKSKVINIPRKQKDNKYTNYFKNFKYFYQKANALSDTGLNKFTKSLIEDCEVIEIKSWKVEQAITMFNSLNSDGLPLLDSDIIAAKSYAAAERNNEDKNFKTMWEELIKNLDELESNNIVDIDGVLMQHMYYLRAKRKEIISESGAVILTTPGLRRYYTEINKSVLDNPIELCNLLADLVNKWKVISTFPVIQTLLKFNNNSKLFIASYLYRLKVEELTEESIEIIAISILRLFTILELVDAGYSSNKFKSFLFEENVNLVDKKISISEIKTHFDLHICNNWDKEDIKELIRNYDGNALVYLNEYLFSKEKNIPYHLDSKHDIEHIMPNSGYNLDVIRKDANIQTKEEFDNYVNKIGNKIVLEQKINRSIGNEWFRSKISNTVSGKNGYKNSVYPIAVHLVKTYGQIDKPYWTKSDIDVATELAITRIANFVFNTYDENDS